MGQVGSWGVVNGALTHLLANSKESCVGFVPEAEEDADSFTISVKIIIAVISFAFAIILYAYYSDQTLKNDRSKIQTYYGVDFNADSGANSSNLMLQNVTLRPKYSPSRTMRAMESPAESAYVPPNTAGAASATADGLVDAQRLQQEEEDKLKSKVVGLQKPPMWKDTRIGAIYRIGVPFLCVANL
mgnify:CR=1 FL=1